MCLDIDDTLIDYTAAGKAALHTLIGRSDMWPVWEWVTDYHVAMVVAGELSYTDLHHTRTRYFLAELGVLVDEADVATFEARRLELLRQSWRLFDDVVPCLEWLRAAGLRIAAVTNASGTHQRAKLADLGLAGFLEHIAIAGETGAAKPDPAMFSSVCRALGAEVSEAVHVGDKLDTDARGARDAGLGGVWLNRAGADPPEQASNVNIIGSLDELPELLVCEYAKIGVPAPR